MLLILFSFKRKKLKETVATFKSLTPAGRRKTIWLNVIGSVFLTLNWFSFIYVMNHISIKATSLAYLVCPILTTVLAYFLLKEKLSKLQWGSVGLGVLGCVFLSYANIIDMVYSLIVGFSYAVYLISQRSNTGFDKFVVLTFHIVLSALMLLPFYPYYSAALPTEFKFYFYVEVIAVAFTIIPLFLNLYALKGLNSSTVGMLLNINPIIAFILANAVYHEHISALQMISYAIIFISVVVFNAHHILNHKRNALQQKPVTV